MNFLKGLKGLFQRSSRTSFSSANNYYSRNPQSSWKYPLILSLGSYLYFQEDVLSFVLTQSQFQYLRYNELIKSNKEKYERGQCRRLLNQSFDPESRIKYLQEKIGSQLGVYDFFEGDFLSTFADDRVREVKENGAQIYLAQRGGGKTLDALRIAKEWQSNGNPVLFFDKSHYGGSLVTLEGGIFEKYGFSNMSVLKQVLKEKEVAVSGRFDIIETINKLFMLGHVHKARMGNTSQQEKQRNPLLVVIDDADDLFVRGQPYNLRKNFLVELKELMKDDLVKILFLCREHDTKTWLQKEFDAGLWKGISKGSPELRSKQVVRDYLAYVSNVTGLKEREIEKYFFYFGVDYATLKDLKKYLSWHMEKFNKPSTNIDDFIEMKIKECAEIFRDSEIVKPLMRVCRQIEENSTTEDKIKDVLNREEKEKLALVLGPEGWVSFKYAAAAYFLCGKSWKNAQNNLKQNIAINQ